MDQWQKDSGFQIESGSCAQESTRGGQHLLCWRQPVPSKVTVFPRALINPEGCKKRQQAWTCVKNYCTFLVEEPLEVTWFKTLMRLSLLQMTCHGHLPVEGQIDWPDSWRREHFHLQLKIPHTENKTKPYKVSPLETNQGFWKGIISVHSKISGTLLIHNEGAETKSTHSLLLFRNHVNYICYLWLLHTWKFW